MSAPGHNRIAAVVRLRTPAKRSLEAGAATGSVTSSSLLAVPVRGRGGLPGVPDRAFYAFFFRRLFGLPLLATAPNLPHAC